MQSESLFAEVLDPKNRADPYPLYARLRENPVSVQSDGRYVVSTYAEIHSLLHDPRMSSDDLPPPHFPRTGNPIRDFILNPIKASVVARHRPFIFRDPPVHDALRSLVMRQLSPEYVRGMAARIHQISHELLDSCADRRSFDIVDDFSYPLPVTVICELLGVPREDEPRFHAWATKLASALEPDLREDEKSRAVMVQALDEMSQYLHGLIRKKRSEPTDDLLSRLAAVRDAGHMGEHDLIATSVMLLVAGHETTVNLISNAMLTLLRYPEHLRRVREAPETIPQVLEEVLRFEPPVHFRTRVTTGEVDIGNVNIPKGSHVVLLFASGNRDPRRFDHPDEFRPDRPDNQHFGFGGSLHYCLGAPLARIEGEIAIRALAERLIEPVLADPVPPYRKGASLRGPEHLNIRIGGIA